MILFREKQRFPWFWTISIFLLILGSLGTLFYNDLTNGGGLSSIPWESWFVALLMILLLVFIGIVEMRTKIDENGIEVQFYPIHVQPKYYAWDKIKSAELRIYKPLREYGGWGIRRSFRHGRAFNIKGNVGLQLILEDGNKLLIGTQKKEDMKSALSKTKLAE